MPRICTLNYFLLCSGVTTTIVLIFLTRSSNLDEKFLPYSKRFNSSTCSKKDGKVTCAESTYTNSFDSFRRLMIFKCSLIILGLCSFAIIRQRHKRLDTNLIQKVNLQIAADV
ncbi:hypothetical protein MN116_007369 [Schistosoma mekongi]|uniref:Uncharacterized protein n=1 Tax=Schistosoma mekongi TaxID=38744 RepID=A0AAE1Z9V8_SCHME|nr:hypothetical protein MN116_007369 [Schistosoma mekongi]